MFALIGFGLNMLSFDLIKKILVLLQNQEGLLVDLLTVEKQNLLQQMNAVRKEFKRKAKQQFDHEVLQKQKCDGKWDYFIDFQKEKN